MDTTETFLTSTLVRVAASLLPHHPTDITIGPSVDPYPRAVSRFLLARFMTRPDLRLSVRVFSAGVSLTITCASSSTPVLHVEDLSIDDLLPTITATLADLLPPPVETFLTFADTPPLDPRTTLARAIVDYFRHATEAAGSGLGGPGSNTLERALRHAAADAEWHGLNALLLCPPLRDANIVDPAVITARIEELLPSLSTHQRTL